MEGKSREEGVGAEDRAAMAESEQVQEAYYRRWLQGLHPLAEDLQKAIELLQQQGGEEQQQQRRRLLLEPKVQRILEHYRDYYRAKERVSSHNVLQAVVPQWRTPLEKAFMWFGGWRPSTVFQLLYGLVGSEVQEELSCVLEGCAVDSGAFGALSAPQLADFSRLQMLTIRREGRLEHDMALLQQSIADEPLLMLAQAKDLANEWRKNGDEEDDINNNNDDNDDDDDDDDDDDGGGGGKDADDEEEEEEMQQEQRLRLQHGQQQQQHRDLQAEYHHHRYHHRRQEGRGEESVHHHHHHHLRHEEEEEHHHHVHGDIGSAIGEKLASLQRILSEADSLRLSTLHHVLDNLEPLPRAIFMLAAAKLHIAFRKIGEHFDSGAT